MPYALIPDGYSLKQVTKLQKKAVDDKRRHDNVVAFLSNDGTPALIGGGALLALTPFLIDAFKTSLEGEGIVLTDEQKSNIQTAFNIALVSNPLTGPFVLGKKLETLVKDLI
jgi:hypothetical protein